MKNKNMQMNLKRMAQRSAFFLAMALGTSAFADVYWNNNNGIAPGGDRNWANAANWIGGLPSALGAGSAIVKPWYTTATYPIVSTTGNTANQIYIDANASLDIVGGGGLSATDLVTGIYGNSGMVTVSGGSLNLSGYLNMGAGGFDGDVSISGGTIETINLTFNAASGSTLDLSGIGSFVAPTAGNLSNIGYWINSSHNITAYGGAAGWSINQDTTTRPGYVILTAVAVPEPSTLAMIGLSLGILGLARRRS